MEQSYKKVRTIATVRKSNAKGSLGITITPEIRRLLDLEERDVIDITIKKFEEWKSLNIKNTTKKNYTKTKNVSRLTSKYEVVFLVGEIL